jgi:hypothetical protein
LFRLPIPDAFAAEMISDAPAAAVNVIAECDPHSIAGVPGDREMIVFAPIVRTVIWLQLLTENGEELLIVTFWRSMVMSVPPVTEM